MFLNGEKPDAGGDILPGGNEQRAQTTGRASGEPPPKAEGGKLEWAYRFLTFRFPLLNENASAASVTADGASAALQARYLSRGRRTKSPSRPRSPDAMNHRSPMRTPKPFSAISQRLTVQRETCKRCAACVVEINWPLP